MAKPEARLQRAIVDLLAVYEKQGWLAYYAVPNKPRSKVQGGLEKRMGSRKGMTDLVVLLTGGASVYLELKAPKGKLKPHQIEWRDRLTRLGFKWVLVKSVDDLMAAVSARQYVKAAA